MAALESVARVRAVFLCMTSIRLAWSWTRPSVSSFVGLRRGPGDANLDGSDYRTRLGMRVVRIVTQTEDFPIIAFTSAIENARMGGIELLLPPDAASNASR